VSDSRIDEQWAFVINHQEERVRRIAERAAREPVLRGLFPYSSMANLKFSRRAE
jgi:hypothetical protein